MNATITISTESDGCELSQQQDVSLPTTIRIQIQRPSGTEVIEIVAHDMTSDIRKTRNKT